MGEPEVEIFFCNKTYNEKWLIDKEKSNSLQFQIIEAIVEIIIRNNGGRISRQEILSINPAIEEYIARRKFKLFPANGQELKGNARGIRHAKYAPTKSVALLWQKIRETIYITFDDHAPVKYHRAIYSFHQIRLGRQVFPLNARCSRKVREILQSKKPWIYRGIDLKKRHY